MGQFKLEIEDLALKHLKQHYKSGDKASIKKIEKILLELSETPFIGVGNPETHIEWFLVKKNKSKGQNYLQSRRNGSNCICYICNGAL